MSHAQGSSRKRFYAVFAAALLVCVLGVSAAALRLRMLGSQPPQQIAQWLAQGSGAEASVQAAEIDVASFRLVAHGVSLHAQDRILLSHGELRARPALGALLRGRFELRSLELDAPSLHVNASDLDRLQHATSGTQTHIAALTLHAIQLQIDLSARDMLQLSEAQIVWSNGHVELHSAKALWLRDGKPNADARVALSGELSAPNAQLKGAGQLHLDAAHLASETLADTTTLNWHADGERLACDGTLAFGTDAGAVTFAVEWSPQALSLVARPAALRLHHALALVQSTLPLDASVDGRLELRGTLSPLALTGPLQLALHDVRLGESALVSVPQLQAAGSARIDTNGYAIDTLRVGLPSGAFEGSARIARDATFDAQLNARELALGDLGAIGGVALAGHGSVALHAQGALLAPTLHASLALEEAAIAGIALGKLNTELDVSQAGRVLDIHHVEIADRDRRLSSDDSQLRFEAGLAEAHARIQVTRLPLAELYRVLGANEDPVLRRLQGDTMGDAELNYRRSASDHQLELGLGLRLADVSLTGYHFERGQLRAHVAIPDGARGLAGGVLTLEQMTLATGDGALDLAGDMRRGVLAMHVAMRGLPLAHDGWFHDHWPLLAGRIDGKGELHVDAAKARADLALTLDDLRFGSAPLGRVQLHAMLRDRAQPTAAVPGCTEGESALASGALNTGEPAASAWLICGDGLRDHLHVDLALGNAEGRPLRGRVRLEEFSLSAFLPDSSPGTRVPGTLSAQLQATGGGLDNLDRMSAKLLVQKLVLGEGDMALVSDAPFALNIDAGALALVGATLDGAKQHFTLSASGSLGHSARLIGDGTIAASAFSRASEPLVEAFGKVGMHVEWAPWAEPRLHARASLNDVTVQVGTSALLKNLSGSLDIDDARVHVAGVGAELGGGSLQLDGQLQLQGLAVASYALKLTAAHVALEPQAHVELLLDADTHVDWTGASALPRLTGGVRLKRALYGRQIQVNEAIAALSHQNGDAKRARDRLQVDLEVSQEQPLHIRNTLLDGEVVVAGPAHKLRIVGSDRQLGLSGQLSITRGRVMFYGDQFNVTHGEIAFTDPSRIAPQFDVSAVADRPKRPDTSIVFRAHGTRETFDVVVHCEAKGAVEPPPFTCKYARDHVHCDSFEQLVALWVCRSKPTLSQADTTR